MMRWLFFLVLLMSSICNFGQFENVWVFGINSGLDFNDLDDKGYPKFIQTKINAQEGTAVACDALGQLLFYTDGTCVFDRNHNAMPNAPVNNLGNWSSGICGQ